MRIPTWAIAELAGVSEWTVRKHAREGLVRRDDLKSVIEYIMERSAK